MTARRRCSEPPGVRARLIVLEGMPGAGKTTVAVALHQQGWQVIGEYTSADGATVAIRDHPGVADDDGHQANWIRKAAQCASALRTGTVYADRDWISSLAYAHSAATADSGELLRRRCAWAYEALNEGVLLLPGAYAIFDLDLQASLQRRSGRLRAGHPWSDPGPLTRLREFYTAPAGVLGPVHPALAAAIAGVPRFTLSGHGHPQAILAQLARLADPS
jgi:predicted ATPase